MPLAKKIDIINNFTSGAFTKTALATKYGIPKSTLTRIIHDKDKLRDAFSNSRFAPQRKRLRLANHEEMEKCLVIWIRRARSQNLPLSGPLIRAKAEFALRLGIENFSCSEGWLSRFKERSGLVFRAVSGESAVAVADACKDWQERRLPEVLRQFSPDDIYNVDETALFFKLLPTRTISFKGEHCTGGKLSKERLTVLVGANMSGTNRLKPLVIGKSKHPRCFNNVTTLPVSYDANTKAWMTQAIFSKWIHGEDARFLRMKRKVLFLVDNCPGHGVVEGLKSITLEFLPANTTALLQPMDQGVIQALKAKFRKNLLQRMLLCMDHGKDYKVDVLRAIYLLDDAWRQVAPTTIANCFRHAGFAPPMTNPVCEDEVQEDDDIQDQDLVQELSSRGVTFSLDEYVTIDANVATCPKNTVDSIVAEVINEENNEETEPPEDETPEQVITLQQAEAALQALQTFFAQQLGSERFLRNLSDMDSAIQKMHFQQLSQVKLDMFFPAK